MPAPAEAPAGVRHVHVVMSARSLPYARCCLASLFRNAVEPLDVTLITDGADDKQAIEDALERLPIATASRWRVADKREADERAAEHLTRFPAVMAFRDGHPCWRKITDPPLFAQEGEEMIVLDPDVYFPNRFAFEPTPSTGVLLMWQRPNCLLPEATVRRAYEQGVALADHTDIGVAQLRAPFDWPFLEELVAKLGGTQLPRSMHVESIVWAALAERIGGGYLDPVAWRCFDNSVVSRLRRRAGRSGVETLAALDIGAMKCLHAGGVAKHWLADAEAAGVLQSAGAHTVPVAAQPFVGYPRARFERKFEVRRVAARFGVYRLLAS